jgi:hypothetical protein
MKAAADEAYDTFDVEVLWEDMRQSITGVAVPAREVWRCALFCTENPSVPMWVVQERLIEKYLQARQRHFGCQGGVVLRIVKNHTGRDYMTHDNPCAKRKQASGGGAR